MWEPATMWKRYAARYLLMQSCADAKAFYKNKVAFVTKNMEQLQETIHKKQDNLRVVGELMQVVRLDAGLTHTESAATARACPVVFVV